VGPFESFAFAAQVTTIIIIMVHSYCKSNFEGQMACSGGFMTRLNKSQLQVEICVPSGLVGVGICSSSSFVAVDSRGSL
jgi:hypothetical protein